MSATPIPRTLQLALSGVRNISTILSAPIERKPIITNVHSFSIKTIKNNIPMQGMGLHSGLKVNITIKPSAPNTGIIFKRIDIKENNFADFNKVSFSS